MVFSISGKKNNISFKDIKTGFILLKKGVKKEKSCQLIEVSTGPSTLEKSSKLINNMISSENLLTTKFDDMTGAWDVINKSVEFVDINYEDFFVDFIEKEADMSVVTIPYNVNVPYAVLETYENKVLNFKEKPTYTYYSNAGIYLVRKNILNSIPHDTFYNATDLMEQLIKSSNKIISPVPYKF